MRSAQMLASPFDRIERQLGLCGHGHILGQVEFSWTTDYFSTYGLCTPPKHHPVRFVTASALFDGHDASINIMRRILQSQGAEVIHLGHNRSVAEVVDAAIDEDVQGVAVSSYQGGHVEYFEYLTESLRERGAGHVKVYGGGGGVIVPEEIERLRKAGVTIFSPEDGQRLGLAGMINTMIEACDTDLWDEGQPTRDARTLRRPRCAGPGRHRRRARPARRGVPRPDPRRVGGVGHARARHHRHRRLRQVLADRRDRPPLPPRPAGQAPHRRHRGRPDASPRWWRPARRPHPDELPRRRPHLLPLAGDPRQPRAARVPARRHRPVQGGRLRPGDHRDARHRPGRRGDRPVRRHVDVRHDAGVRRRLAAREDRHARLRRRRRDQQVRAPRRQGRAARRRPPARAQPRGVRQEARGHAGVRHLGGDVQRRRRHRALPAPDLAPGSRGARGHRGHPAGHGRTPLQRHRPGRTARAHPLPRRDHRDGPRLSRDDRRARREGPPRAAARGGGGRSSTSSGRARRAARRGPQGPARRHRRAARGLARRRRVLLPATR